MIKLWQRRVTYFKTPSLAEGVWGWIGFYKTISCHAYTPNDKS
ncbi:hypothetical protein [Helicobacter sp. MIT 01-3238]|nr:hypothetical protein [Helicobacter sp. MIT 01-3238]